MRFRYYDVATDRTLDVVTLTDGKAEYMTGKARQMVENQLRFPGGAVVAQARFKSWSNGYVSTLEMAE